jgi:hypothetical protein
VIERYVLRFLGKALGDDFVYIEELSKTVEQQREASKL